MVSQRAAKLRIESVQSCDDKWLALERLLAERGIEVEAVVYVGNDLNDLDCLRHAGVPVAVADAYPEVKAVARYVTCAPGGRGAVREVCDLIIRARTRSDRTSAHL